MAEGHKVRLLARLMLAVEQGDAGSQFEPGLKYAHGDGVLVDKAKAAQLYAQAAEQGHACSLGLLFHEGQVVERDEAKAARLFVQAAEQGLAAAQCMRVSATATARV
jgi:TPR repeat protein